MNVVQTSQFNTWSHKELDVKTRKLLHARGNVSALVRIGLSIGYLIHWEGCENFSRAIITKKNLKQNKLTLLRTINFKTAFMTLHYTWLPVCWPFLHLSHLLQLHMYTSFQIDLRFFQSRFLFLSNKRSDCNSPFKVL